MFLVKEKHNYFSLNEENIPVPCSHSQWSQASAARDMIAKEKVGYSKVLTKFIGIDDEMFKTTVYNNYNYSVFVQYYQTYQDARQGHKTIVKEKPWEKQK